MESAETESGTQRHDVEDGNSEPQTPRSNPQVIVPAFWQHRRGESFASVRSNAKPPPISLEDHTEEPSELSASLWAKGVSVNNHVVISGNVPGVGDYVVWTCKVDTLDVSTRLLSWRVVLSIIFD